MIALLSVFLLLSGFVYYNTNILKTYHAREQRLDQQADYEKQYKTYEDLPELSIIDLNSFAYP